MNSFLAFAIYADLPGSFSLLNTLCRYLVELALMNADFLNWRASMVAAAAVALSRYTAIHC